MGWWLPLRDFFFFFSFVLSSFSFDPAERDGELDLSLDFPFSFFPIRATSVTQVYLKLEGILRNFYNIFSKKTHFKYS